MGLNDSQSRALQQVLDFVASDRTTFSLQGGAGVGKTFLVGVLIKDLMAQGHACTLAAPTHKACRVLRSKLDSWGVRWVFKPQGEVPAGWAVVDTTAALLGIRPVIDDDQDEHELVFKPTPAASVGRLFSGNLSAKTPVLLIDEVSMLGRDDLHTLTNVLEGRAKLVCVGDEGQLPPVKKQAIDFEEDFEEHALLDEVVRQAKGSSIVSLAWKIRSGDASALDSADLLGGDVVRVSNVGAAFVEQVSLPVDDESQRAVYIAYRNAVVDSIQNACCLKLYGHTSKAFEKGELVLSTSAAYRENKYYVDHYGVQRLSKWPKMEQLAANADQLRVVDIAPEHDADPIYGRDVELDRVDLPANAKNRRFCTSYLSEEQAGNAAHPFNVRKAALLKTAKELQAKTKEKFSHEVDQQRKDAWSAFFKHQQRVVSFAHPFAITSHKSQGSTYREAFVNASDLLRFDRRALYVAVTRPSKRLVI